MFGRGIFKNSLVLVPLGFALLAAAPALAGTIGHAGGPSAVRPGRLVRFSAKRMLPRRTVLVTIQPAKCVGSNGCAVAARGRWKTDANGSVQVRFRFPRRYFSGCAGNSCAEHPAFVVGTHAEVQLCVVGPEAVGEESQGLSCAVKSVRIAGRH